ncbi:MAG: Gfo/Idh/MocA family oxidoreductase [Gemmatimonadetes bacterium]|jgi:predicted dehydrogenase|nr:Gfo/Idh/MocA family oxidoreductase [Gemmatimonadota bacterium]MBT7859486.1 Gfo/Idh/MocA family oxidoreductase [Gemmatimonadota bacterium]
MSPTDKDSAAPIQGFEPAITDREAAKDWTPVSDRKIRVGIAGYGVCNFGAAFHFQDHPNVTVAAVADLDPDKRSALAQACRCENAVASCEELIGDDSLEAIFVATDAPSHAQLAIAALEAGKHVASAVPAVFGSLEDADALFAAVKKSDRKYMMFETSYFHEDLYCMREMYRAGLLGKVIYAEGEYWHHFGAPLGAHGGWRTGLPPQWYPTHSNAYYVGVTGGSFTEVSCMGMPSVIDHLKAENNQFGNPFGTEIALFRTSEGSMARMAVSWDTPGAGGEMGRIRTEKGVYSGEFHSGDKDYVPPTITRPPLPPGVDAGGHGGSHGQLMCEFVEAILLDRTPLVDIAQSLNMTVSGIVAHQSALKDGELLKIPQYSL